MEYLIISTIFFFLISNIVLEENVATPKHGATVVNGEVKNALLDGDSSNYDMERGFTRHPIDDNSEKGIIVTVIINGMSGETEFHIVIWTVPIQQCIFHLPIDQCGTMFFLLNVDKFGQVLVT